MFIYPEIDPVIVSIGPLKVHWYGLMYLFGFIGAWILLRYQIKNKSSYATWKNEEVDDLIFYLALGVIFGGRLGYLLFYNFSQFINNPLILVKIWQGGMSFHGGLLGVIAAIFYFQHKYAKTFWKTADLVAPVVCVGLFAGRIGNFINGELWGKITDIPWAMVFPHVDMYPRHPSMLYEAFFEGPLLFLLLWWFGARPRPFKTISGLFLIGYGVIRFLIEFVRTPDQHIGYLYQNWLTMGQILSAPMILFGIFLMLSAYRNQR